MRPRSFSAQIQDLSSRRAELSIHIAARVSLKINGLTEIRWEEVLSHQSVYVEVWVKDPNL